MSFGFGGTARGVNVLYSFLALFKRNPRFFRNSHEPRVGYYAVGTLSVGGLCNLHYIRSVSENRALQRAFKRFFLSAGLTDAFSCEVTCVQGTFVRSSLESGFLKSHLQGLSARPACPSEEATEMATEMAVWKQKILSSGKTDVEVICKELLLDIFHW